MHEKKGVANLSTHILQDVSEASLTRAIEESLVAYQVSLAQLPGAVVHDTPHLLWVTTGVPIVLYNGVFRSILDPLDIDAQITRVVEEFRRRRLPIYWLVGPSSQPASLSQHLLAHNFLHAEDEPGMALDLLAMNEDFSVPAGLDIRLVEDLSALNAWVAVWQHDAPDTLPLFQHMHAQLGFGLDLPWRYYLGAVEGKPVATVLLFFGAGVAAIHRVVTLPEVRGQGIGTAMTLAALQEARKVGYRIAILTASPYGEHIYRRIGFRAYCTISRYSWQAPTERSSEENNT